MKTGGLKLNDVPEIYFPDFSVEYPCFSLPFLCKKEQCYYWEPTTSEFGNCVIRVANSGGFKLERLSTILGITRERVRQIEASALRHLAWVSTKRGLTPQIRRIVEKTFGDVCRWPLQPFDVRKYSKRDRYSRLELLNLAFYLGILSKFTREGVESLPVVECFTLGCVTSSLVCLLCDLRASCEFTPVKLERCNDYLTVSSFYELLLNIKVKLGLILAPLGDSSDAEKSDNL